MGYKSLVVISLVANLVIMAKSSEYEHRSSSSSAHAEASSSSTSYQSTKTPTSSTSTSTATEAETSADASSSSSSSEEIPGSSEENQCPCDEEYSDCLQSLCKPKLCSEKGQQVTCEDVDGDDCIGGCVCKDGYLRNNNGTCVPECECSTDCGPGETLDNCPSICESQYCPTSNGGTLSCPTPDDCPAPVCKCSFNYRRAENGTCIPTRDCPPFDCSKEAIGRPNEAYYACPPFCPSDNCSQASPTGVCPLPGRIGIVVQCNPTCRCIEGYWRKNGTCVPYGECPGVCPAHEVYSTCIQGECRALNCTQKNKPIACPRIDPKHCKSGCICKKGYLRDAKGKCVRENKCEENQCKSNEVYSNCTQAVCKPKLCSEKGQEVTCDDVDPADCTKGCVCQDGYLRNNNATCVPEDKCSTNCSSDETLDDCPSICDSQYCPTTSGGNLTCPRPDTCPDPVCKCRFNYRRAQNGTCIPTRDCPPFSCNAENNEQYVPCPPICPNDGCNLPRVRGVCPFRIGIILECNPQCQCKENYGRTEEGVCVPYAECPNLCPKNEQYSPCIQTACQQNCTDRNRDIECPEVSEDSCKKGCICKENYYRNKKGACVPVDQCEKDPRCPYPHETYTDTKASCPPDTCIALVIRVSCTEYQSIGPGCVCDSGRYRLNTTSPCIPMCECPEMAGTIDCQSTVN